MGKRESLGDFEQLVILAVLRLGPNAYGTRIKGEIEGTAERTCSAGALYTTLERLEEKGYISSWVGEATPERGGRAKKYFRVQAAGSSALKQAFAATSRMVQGLEPLLRGVR
jgi:PadR family transcriptional regulator, regulatory protein PadR